MCLLRYHYRSFSVLIGIIIGCFIAVYYSNEITNFLISTSYCDGGGSTAASTEKLNQFIEDSRRAYSRTLRMYKEISHIYQQVLTISDNINFYYCGWTGLLFDVGISCLCSVCSTAFLLYYFGFFRG